MSDVLWTPSAEFVRGTNFLRFQQFCRDHFAGPQSDDYPSWHHWSLDRRGDFWTAVWRFTGVIGDRGDVIDVPGLHLTDAKWFPDAKLSYAVNLTQLIGRDEPGAGKPAVIFRNEAGHESILSRTELFFLAIRFGVFLHERGVGPGDRVVGLLPNVPTAVVAMLGTAHVGAVWSSCSPDFGEDAVVERFAQLDPVVLVTTASTTYAGKRIDVAARAAAVRNRLPTVRTVIATLDDLPALPTRSGFDAYPFDHPLFVLFSSGTTGPPKGIVHGAGGTLLQHLKEHQLHTDIRPGDRLFYYTTTGWMMWNWLVSALASRATICLYDGSPLHPNGHALWDFAARHRVTHFGASAKYYATLEKASIRPREMHDLSALRCVLSTGSPLLPDSFDYIFRDIKPDVNLASISGGTDIISCFALGMPTEPVRRGELQVKGLGMDVAVFDDAGNPVVGKPGELVCRSPFPSMPVGFWNDPERTKYLASYFGVFDNVWHHGDYATETPTGGLVISGRSDTTLNPGGVRIGTAEIYRQVEQFSQIAEAAAIPLKRDGDEKVILFVRMQPGQELTAELIAAIHSRLRTCCSPRHVPSATIAAPDFPRTVSGKLSEVAVRNAVNGLPVKNEAALANPESLAFFRTVPGLP